MGCFFLSSETQIFSPTILYNITDKSKMTNGDMGFCIEDKKIYLKIFDNDAEPYGGLSEEEIITIIESEISKLELELRWNTPEINNNNAINNSINSGVDIILNP